MWPALDVGRLTAPPDLFQAALLDYEVAAIDDHAPDAWRIFFHTAGERDRALHGVARDFPDLTLESIDVPDEDWAARSQASLRAIQVGALVVAPPWDAPDNAIIIQPSMGFGTGHHATTRLCLAALQQMDLNGRSALDVGTGSGVLAIAANRLGASTVLAIDDDPDAVQSARENVALNAGVRVDVRILDLRSAALPASDVVMANLTGALLIRAAARLQDLAAPGGRLVLSGFTKHEAAAVLDAFDACRVAHRAEEDEWQCVTLQKR